MNASALLLVLLLPLPALADCRIALALALDDPRSVDAADYEIQRLGLIAALNDPAIREALLQPRDRVNLAIYEWSGEAYQAMVADWQQIDSAAQIDALAARIQQHQRPEQLMLTAMGVALVYGLALIDRAPPCARQVIDISGDGQNNLGIRPATAYKRHDFGAIMVNGLAIGEHESQIFRYYQQEVIRGPGAFVQLAQRQADFPRAIRRKLLRELTEPVLGQETIDPVPAWRDTVGATSSGGVGRVTGINDHQRRPGPVGALRDPQG